MSAADRVIRTAAAAVPWALAGLAVTALSTPLLEAPFFMFQFAAVVGAALQGGFGAGALALALSGLGFYSLYYAPTLERFEAFRLLAFLLVSTFFSWLAARMRRARADAEAARARAEAAEAEARAIGAQQERLVAVVSHDLRNPLSAITVTTQALALQAQPQQARGLARIEASARRMEAMVRDLLDFARSRHGGGLPVRPRPSRLGALCRAAIDEVRTGWPSRAVALDVAGDDEAPLDPGRVEQVVSNLVANAFAHGEAGTPVLVTVRGEADAVRLEVVSRGATIPPHRLATLFDPFHPSDAPGGVGLGLFIVDQVARAHGGGAAVRSVEGETSFTVVFPRAAPPGREPVSAAPTEPRPGPTG